MKKQIILWVVAACTLVGCMKNKKGNFTLRVNSRADMTEANLEIDTIRLDSVVTSYVIETSLRDSVISVLDKYFGVLYRFNLDGSFKEKKLGRGHAKSETSIGHIATHAFMDNGDLFLLDYSGGHHIYDKDIQMKDFFRVIYENSGDGSLNKDKLYKTPSEYTHLYNDIVCRSYKNNVYFNVRMSYPMCCYVNNTKQHLEENANILEVKLDEQEFGRLLAVGYPDSYQKNSLNKAIFSSVNYDIAKNGDFYVTYEADTLIYQYDCDYEQKKCFGYAGKDMDLNYRYIKTPKESGKYWRNERQTKGYYNWLEYVDETGLLFRSYQKGGTRPVDGLQFYKDGVLIGDVNVPKGLKVCGYVSPYYYSYVMPNEEREIMYLYRFKL